MSGPSPTRFFPARALTHYASRGCDPSPSLPADVFDARIHGAIRALGLDVRIGFDLEVWKRFVHATEWGVVNASSDPAFHDFAPGEAVWLRLVHGAEIVATQVLRTIETADFVGMVRDHTLFFGRHPSQFREFRMLCGDDAPRIGGRVVSLSGLYIRPAWRRVRTADGMRLVAAWVALSHSFTTRSLKADWSVTLVERRLSSARMTEDLYGYPHAIPAFESFVPEFGQLKQVSLLWMSAAELVVSVAQAPVRGAPVRRRAVP